MKEYQNLIGMIIIAIAIIIAGYLIAEAIENESQNIHSSISYNGEMIRDGLLQFGRESK